MIEEFPSSIDYLTHCETAQVANHGHRIHLVERPILQRDRGQLNQKKMIGVLHYMHTCNTYNETSNDRYVFLSTYISRIRSVPPIDLEELKYIVPTISGSLWLFVALLFSQNSNYYQIYNTLFERMPGIWLWRRYREVGSVDDLVLACWMKRQSILLHGMFGGSIIIRTYIETQISRTKGNI